ncbi:MAG: sodium:solute symporter family protein [Lachnospiraceae bacterium]|jgi:SSS family solute:Na+ symporter|nr:sodium:solute symporter family protein [Lachnospiraceae bacterium]
MVAKILLLCVFFAVMIAIGLYTRKHATDVDGFVLGSRSAGPWISAFAYGTSYFSAVVFVGYAGQFGWKYGIASTWVGIGNTLIGSLLAWALLGRRTRIMTQHIDAKTMPDFFGKRYGSNSLKIAASLITFVFLIPYTASVYNGLSRLFGMAFDIPYSVCLIVMAVLTGLYVILGGYMATALNDFVQGIFMLFGICAVIYAVLEGQGGFYSALSGLAAQAPAPDEVLLVSGEGIFASFFGPDPLNLLGVVILTSLGTWGLPQMVGKFYAIKSEESVKTGMIVSTFFALVIAGGCYFLGGFGRLFSDRIDIAANGYDSIIPTMLSTLPDILIGVVIVLVLSASMSTLSSLVLTSSSTLTIDFLGAISKKKQEEKKQVFLMRVFVVVFVIISVLIALNKDKIPNIAQLMGYSWGALAGAFLAPFLYGLYWKKVTKLSVWVSFIFSVAITVANMMLSFIKSPINAGAFTMLASLILVPIVSLVTPKIPEEDVEKIFTCYEQKVQVPVRKALD